ncbi:MAG: cytochrome c oxidase assembly protein [Gaiellaceae bacterium]
MVVVAALVYAVGLRVFPASRRRVASFAAGLLVVLAVTITPLGTLALTYHLWAHLVQNVALAEWAPALCVAGLPPAMTAELGRYRLVRVLTRPYVGLPLWLITYGIWHIPPVYDAALRGHYLLHLEHATYFTAGVLLWWPIFHEQPWRLSAGAKSAYLFLAFVLASPLGLLLALLPSPIYDFYVEAPRIWGISALQDQQIAGVAMAVSEAIVFFGVFAWFFVRFMAEEEAGYSQPHA